MADNILIAKNISKSFGGIHALKNFSFSVKKNSITALIGPNGAGKTTVFNIISRIYQQDSGEIFFQNKDITNFAPHQLPQLGISRTFQNIVLFPNMNLVENIMVGGHIYGSSSIFKYLFAVFSSKREDELLFKRAMNNLEFVGLQKLAYSEISELTFGQLRLAEIARCLMSDSELLLLDEPAAGLNPKETEDLARLLLEIKKIGKTIFIVEHDMNLVMTISEKIIVLNFGEFLAKGTPSEISTNPQVIASYLGDDQYIG